METISSKDRLIGQAIPRVEDERLVLGRGAYTDDLRAPGALHTVVVRAAYAYAEIKGIDTEAARAMPGVVAVLTQADYAADGCLPFAHVPSPFDAVDVSKKALAGDDGGAVCSIPQWPLAADRVRFVGEPVALVIAETAAAAADAADVVVVDYAELPSVQTIAEALADGAPQLYSQAPGNRYFTNTIGDEAATEAAFAAAARVFRARFDNNRVVNCQLEPRAVVATYDPAGGFTIVTGSQGVSKLHRIIARMLAAPVEAVRIVTGDVGGGFGPLALVQAEQVLMPWAARRLGRQVRWTSTRSEAFLADFQGRDARADVEIAFDTEGRIAAYRIDMAWNVGAHTAAYVPAANAMRLLTTVYRVPAVFGRIHGVASNTVPTAPYRGAGRPEAHHCIERILDIASDGLGIDRLELRRRNLIRRDAMPYRTGLGLTYDSGDFVGNMELAAKAGDWDGFPARRAAALARGKLAGIGIANHIESPAGQPMERLCVTIGADGIIDMITGTQSSGQGHETSFAQVAGDLFGAPLAHIRLRTGDTAFVANGGGTQSDRSMRLVATLMADAADKLEGMARGAAAMLLDVETTDLTFARGVFRHEASDRALSLTDIARAIAAGEVTPQLAQPLTVTCDFYGRLPAYPCGAAVCELEIDRDTGHVEIVRYLCVDDVGQVI
ncbi:MAG: xanthine dehydrogenase family protein molybdopterin-binding subunit, partial [Caulobacteraceae bacterium]|nr:xanthine dehydrogenase family protein molybdopterin-binding subunit [Caulobacteraceae bacterium]